MNGPTHGNQDGYKGQGSRSGVDDLTLESRLNRDGSEHKGIEMGWVARLTGTRMGTRDHRMDRMTQLGFRH